MIYKTLKKVSEYCQLLDKSKFPATQTVYGVTFTNNGDGTITVNGTATYIAGFLLFRYSDSLIPEHKYLLFGSPNDASANAYLQCYDATNGGWLNDRGGGSIAIFPKQVVNPNDTMIRIRIATSYTANNLTFKPQFFDLTEMYGAGNEPTTVEEFRTKFPNELYDYKPYCFVKSYKNCLKVSDVCQLLDKSKFPSSVTKSGITTTSNGDGSITINGTATASNFINCTPTYSQENNGHIFYICANNTNMSASTWYYSLLNQVGATDYGEGVIAKTNASSPRYTGIVFNNGVVFDNVIIKPQIIDLTEMYGSGNEPTTIEQFRADFPNELYDYKPYSIVPSYKKSLICTTKNLFDKNNVVNGYINEYGVLAQNDGWKASDFIPITSNTSYTISGISYVGNAGCYAWYDMNKKFISSVSNKINSQTMISPPGASYIRVCCKQDRKSVV